MSELLSHLGVRQDAPGSLAHRSLEAVRQHLGMDVAYLSEFVGDETVFREVDAPGLDHLISKGDRKALSDVYCRHILEGRLPELIPDTAAEPLAVSMPITSATPIGAHVSVPIRRKNGDLYGMFCCLSAEPRPTLNSRDLHIVRAFAGLVAEDVEREQAQAEALLAKAAGVRDALRPGALAIHLQPICDLASGAVMGFEALARFDLEPRRSPDAWFAQAAETGLDAELECAAIAAALDLLPDLPERMTLSVNASPATVSSGALEALLAGAPLDRIVLELTEHALVTDYDALLTRLEPLRERGARLAVDDAGAGFSGLQHILRLRPDVIKLDMTLIRGIDEDPARRALAAAMQAFARQTGAVLVAEGVETQAELRTLATLGFQRGQGFLLGRPALAADVLAELKPQLAAAG